MSGDREHPGAPSDLAGRAWSDFCRALEAAGAVVADDDSGLDPLDRAEGYRYLTRLLRAGLETFVEHRDPRAPVLQRVVHETVKMGADNPDNYYQNAAVSGAYTYRLWGRRGSVHTLTFHTQRGHYGQGAGMPPTGKLDAADLVLGADGSFEVTLSVEPAAGNWLPMAPDTGTLIVRQTFLDRTTEELAELHIERTGGRNAPAPLDPEELAEGLRTTAALVTGASMLFASWAKGFQAHTNTLPRFDDEVSTRFGGDPAIAYYHSYWRLDPGEALVIDVTPPACAYWNFQLNNHWMESLDYRYFPVHVNKHTARYRPDGSVRIVVSAEDPGRHGDWDGNWIDTAGHRRGTMCLRWARAADHPEPRCRVVSADELRPAERR